MQTAEYDFPLPEEHIASRPAVRRDSSRLLILNRDGSVIHKRFADLPELLDPGDLLIVNDSKVLPARLPVRKAAGEVLEILVSTDLGDGCWSVLSKGGYTGEVSLPGGRTAALTGGHTIRFPRDIDVRALLRDSGFMPLPPYIRRSPDIEDRERYQTVYAREEGSIAAPTAGLHFTNELLAAIASRSIAVRSITLHVGTGTFKPVRSNMLHEHRMDTEAFSFNSALLDDILRTREAGGRVIAVGTTTTRTLEGYASGRCRAFSENGTIRGITDIFIHEGHRFRMISGLLTNFHLPRSTPLMLTAALAGREKLLSAYQTAIAHGYRFFSYGDAMLVL